MTETASAAPAIAEPGAPKVAVIRADCRRAAVAQALALLAPEIKRVVAAEVLIKPNLASHRVQAPSTHADTLSATLDMLLALGARQVTVAEGASGATAAFDRFGFRRETWGRPVRFLDLNREEAEWEPITLRGVQGQPLVARLSRTIAEAPCRVSLALAKTHGTSIVALSLENMLSGLHPDDRVMMHGAAAGDQGNSGWRRVVVELLDRDNAAIRRVTRLLGRLKRLRAGLEGKDKPDGWRRLSAADVGFLRSVEAMSRNLVELGRRTRPRLSVVDGFVAMHREGPRHGTPIRLGTVIAGTDPVAVDAVSVAVMGFEPMRVAYLRYAHEAGLGVADPTAMTLVGDPVDRVRGRLIPHSNHAVQRHWDRLAEWTGAGSPMPSSPPGNLPPPHVPAARPAEASEAQRA